MGTFVGAEVVLSVGIKSGAVVLSFIVLNLGRAVSFLVGLSVGAGVGLGAAA